MHREEIQNLHTSPNVVWAMNSKRIKREEHVARMGKSWEKQLAIPSYRAMEKIPLFCDVILSIMVRKKNHVSNSKWLPRYSCLNLQIKTL